MHQLETIQTWNIGFYIASTKCTSTPKMEVSPFYLISFDIKSNQPFRKELQYILHSRHKAEIEILTSKQYNSEPISASDVSSAAISHLDNTYDGRDVLNGHTSPSYNPASTLLDSIPSAHLVSSSNSSKHGTHVLLVRYLSMKVTNYVVSARRRSPWLYLICSENK